MSKDKKIVFRCYGGPTIGWGHVMRCLHVAQWLQGKYKIYFVINQNAEICEYLRTKNITVFEIGEKGTDEKHEEKTLNTVLSLEPHMVINDIHETSLTYMQALKSKNIKIVNFDDTGPGAKLAHVAIDAHRKEKEGKCFGTAYIVLSSLFHKVGKKVRPVHKRVKTIVASFGGSDPAHITLKTLRALAPKLPPAIGLYTIIGKSVEHTESFEEWKRFNNILCVEDCDDLSVPLTHADIAIVSGGITMYESLCLGVPTVVIAQNKAQAKNARRMEKKGAVIYLGEGSKISEKKIMRKVLALIDASTQRERLAARGRKEIDGKGIFRILEQIELWL